jgi:two-component system cell cycle sensor histidine kinase/response regulator CckA
MENPVSAADDNAKSHSVVILLAEDEPLVRNLVHTVLVDDGYVVLDAEDGEQALRLSREYDGSIDALLTDVRMPKMDGLALSSHILRERPGIKVLLMSGKLSGEPLVLTSSAHFLRKPFLPDVLRQKVKGLLG